MMKDGLKKKVFLWIIMIAVVMMVASVVTSYFVYSTRYRSAYTQLSTDIVSSTKSLCAEEDIADLKAQVLPIYQELSENGETVHTDSATEEELAAYRANYASVLSSESYANVRQILQKMLENNHVMYLYIGFFDPDSGDFVYLADASADSNISYPGDIETENSNMTQKILANDYTLTGYFDTTSSFGQLCSTYIPVYDQEGRYICNIGVDIEMNEIVNQRRDFLFSMVVFMLLLMIPLVIFALHFTEKKMVRPIREISDALSDFISEKRDDEAASKISALSIHTHDEIEALSDSVQEMEHEIDAYITEITTIAGEKERLRAELDIATRIQEGLLPHIFPAFPNDPEIDLYATMNPAKEVGGDFYDFFHVDEGHVGIVIGDVSGKGIPAALFMMISKTLIKDNAQKLTSPKEVIETVNDQLCENNEANMFVTVWIGILELSTGEIRYVNAGHEHPALRRASGVFELKKERHDLALGIMEGISYQEHVGKLEPGDTLFVYTDGVPEASDAESHMFGTDRTISSLNHNLDEPLPRLLDSLKEDVDRFVAGAPQFDDQTMLAVLYKRPQP